ncbi:MAG: NAD(P)/FAD-dependent oxidoreductase [Actinobacteria bacterium]|nr:NAD(P)/FAD-dependent oxidoreductase [Actinomycetota bacterium]
MSERYDAIVIGAGPAGEVAVSRLADAGVRTALVERELVGGECAYWACIPSKTLLRPVEVSAEAERTAGTSAPAQSWPEIAAYRDYMIRELEDTAQVAGYREQGVDVYKGAGRLAGPGRVQVGDDVLESERVVIATGSRPRVPPIEGLGAAGYWTNREATTLHELPESVLALGGGPVGVELGQFLARMGARVTMLEAGERLLAREDPAVSELLAAQLRADGVDVRLGAQVERISREDGGRTVAMRGGESVRGQELLLATGREPRLDDLGLETVGIQPGARGIAIDERCRAAEGVWAIGDVTGVMPFTHVGMYQGRIAVADILGRQARADYTAIPRVVFCVPEVAAVGLTEARAREQGIEVAATRLDLAESLARPWTYERDPRGQLGLIADRGRGVLLGAWAVGPLAGEWIHYAALAIKTATPLEVLRDTVAQFPTYSEGYLKAIEDLPL